MSRNIVQVARMRLVEVLPGDVVNRLPEATDGWFEVAIIETLFNGKIQFSSADRAITLSGGPMDICGVQVLKAVDNVPIPTPPEVPSEA